MNRIIAGRSMGKTTQTYNYADYLSHKYPDKDIYFVTTSLASAEMIARKHSPLPENLHIICHSMLEEVVRGRKDYYLVIDELDYLLERFNVAGYSITIM